MTTAGVIGLGQIGGGVALCLARAGLLQAVYDIRPDAGKDLRGQATIAGSPAELARKCDVIIVAVVSAEQTIDVLSGPDGVLAGAHSRSSVVLLATVGLGDLARIRAVTDTAGVPLIDCGVAGGPKSAENGIICLVGAEPEQLTRVRPVLDGFARYVAHMGGPGAGMAAKIVRNTIAVGCLRAGYEGAALAKAAGVDLAKIIQIIDDTADAGIGPLMLMGRPGDPSTDPAEARYRQSIHAQMVKDIQAALELGAMTEVGLPLLELTTKTSREVVGIGDS